jgi:8-oxo-dGTP pyrophosphatase MutT (NUDIX family)
MTISGVARPILPQLPADWRARLRANLLAAPDHRAENYRLGGLASPTPAQLTRLREEWPAALHSAAVLVGITDQDAPTLLMTVRAQHLRNHAGQISFPGGRREPHDADIAAVAIRETQEEIGIDPAFVTPIGYLGDHLIRSGFRVTPVVALLRPGFTLTPDRREVAAVFELPLALALAIESYRQQQGALNDLAVNVWELPFGEHVIWGATAGFLMHLCEVVSGGSA